MKPIELRHRILETVSKNGGHLASSLGAVEIAMALAEVFSQAMQFLSLRPLTAALGEQSVAALRQLNLYDVLDTFLWETLYAEFEFRAFRLENPSTADLNALMWSLFREYGLDEYYG